MSLQASALRDSVPRSWISTSLSSQELTKMTMASSTGMVTLTITLGTTAIADLVKTDLPSETSPQSKAPITGTTLTP